MFSIEHLGTKDAHVWKSFVKREGLSEDQERQFATYLGLLLEWNQKINLTRITDFSSIVAYHFQDSLRVSDFVDFNSVSGAADVGSGAGFPGIPLCIKFPQLHMTLLEVCSKKAAFLELVIKELGLSHCTVTTLDWRTFLRQTDHNIDVFLSRASLQPEELVRMFKPSSPYKHGKMIYFASKRWQAAAEEKAFLVATKEYTVGDQQRVYAFFSLMA